MDASGDQVGVFVFARDINLKLLIKNIILNKYLYEHNNSKTL